MKEISRQRTSSFVVQFWMSVRDTQKRKLKKPYAASYGGVAQLGEHLPCKQGVRGSNPLTSTRNAIREMGP